MDGLEQSGAGFLLGSSCSMVWWRLPQCRHVLFDLHAFALCLPRQLKHSRQFEAILRRPVMSKALNFAHVMI